MDRKVILGLFSILAIGLLIPAYADVSSPLKQYNMGIPIDEIQCNDDKVLVESSSGKPACVFEDTAKKLETRGWEIIDNNISLYQDSTYDFVIKYPKSWVVNESSEYSWLDNMILGINNDDRRQYSSIWIMKNIENGYDIIKNEKLNCADSILQTDSGCYTGGSLSQDVIINDKPVIIHQLLSTSYSFGHLSSSYHKVIIDLKTENTTWSIHGVYPYDLDGEYPYDIIEEKAIVSDRIIKKIVNSFKINGYEYDWYSELNTNPNLILDIEKYTYTKSDDFKVSITNNLNKSLYSIAGILDIGPYHDRKESQCLNPKIIDELKPNQTKQMIWDMDVDCLLLWGEQILTLQVDYIDDKKSTNPMQEFVVGYYFDRDAPKKPEPTYPEPTAEEEGPVIEEPPSKLTATEKNEQWENSLVVMYYENEISPKDVFEYLLW